MDARLRPRFRLRVDLEADAVMNLFAQQVADGRAPCVLQLYEYQVEFSVTPERRHFWSPFLNLIVEQSEGETTLFGKYGPNINVWSMFLAAYAASFITGTAGFFIGTSQLQLDQPTSGFWLTAGCIVTTACVYVAGRVGRHLAHPQMVVFHEFVETLFGEHVMELDDEEAK